MTLNESVRDRSYAPFAQIGTRMRNVVDANGKTRLALDTPMAREHGATRGRHYRIPTPAEAAERLLRRWQREA